MAEVLEILALSSDDFDETLKVQERVLVDFYAPWCGHCQELEPEFKQAANDARAEDLETVFAKVDVTANKDLAKQYKVRSFPTLHYFEDGKLAKTYDGDRKATAIMSWLRKQENPSITVLKEEDVDQFLKDTVEGEFAMVARVKEGSVRHKAFSDTVGVALASYETTIIKFAVVLLPKEADAKADASLLMLRPGFTAPDPERLTFPGVWKEASIASWARNSTYPTIGHKFDKKKYNPTEIELIGGRGSVVVLLDDSSAISAEEGLKPKMLEGVLALAHAYPHWRFTFADHGELQGREFEILGAAIEGRRGYEPLVCVLEGNQRFVLEGTESIQNLDNVKQFLSDVMAKKVKPRHKSAEPPEKPEDDDGVAILTGSNFEANAFNATKDVFVFFYGPKCPHSREMRPEWGKLALRSAQRGWKDRGVVIARMDATENSCEEEITRFPKLVLYPAVAKAKKFKQRVLYRGERTLSKMTDFLAENARNLEAVADSEGTGETKKAAYSMVDRELQKKKKKAKAQEL